MDRTIAENLVTALGKHKQAVMTDPQFFLDILLSATLSDSSRFSETLPDNQQLAQETRRYYYLSLRRVLRNTNARHYQLSPWKKTYEAVASAFGAYSSDALTRNLRANTTLVDLMAQSKEPFSLLGKLQLFDFDNPDEQLYTVTQPILIIPGTINTQPLLQWEDANTTYEKEVGLFLRHAKRITPEEYFAH